MLDERVQVVAHHLSSRRSQNAARPETTRAKLHCAAKPAYDLPLRQQSRDLGDQLVFGQRILVKELAVVENALDRLIVELRPQKSVPHLIDPLRISKHLMPDMERCADRAACVTGSR